MHNKLRRAIEQEQRASYDQPHEKIAAQSALLTRALMALGGPVDSERPPDVTMESVPVDEPNEALEQQTMRDDIARGTPVMDRDLGDETDYNSWADGDDYDYSYDPE